MPSEIIIVGLGSGGSQQWTLAAAQLLQEAEQVYLRTIHHPSVVDISASAHSFDDRYNQTGSLSKLNEQIAAEIVRLGQREQGVIYAVPGHPNFDEPTVLHIRKLAQANNIPVRIIPGLSLLEATFTALEVDPPGNIQLVNAEIFAGQHHPPLEPDRPALITQVQGQRMAAQIKQVLLNAYADDFNVTILQMTTAGIKQWACPLSTVDMQPLASNMLTTLYLPANGSPGGFSTFQETIAHLRAPEGCPWDRAQTHQTLRPFLLEETYEVLEALDAADSMALAEELGDLLLQIVLHTQIAIDAGEFKMSDVIEHINRKLIRRHPHVFGNVVVNGAHEVTANWEVIKKSEKAAKGRAEEIVSALDGIPAVLPALAQALAISKRAVRVGFEWPNIEGVLDKVIEEAHEIVEATDVAHLESEIGDLLFSVVNLARWRNIDPESALRATNARFRQRFKAMEALAAAQGNDLQGMSVEEMDELWEEAKKTAE